MFGFKTVLSQLSGGDLIKERELVKLSVAEVYMELQLRSHVERANKEYVRNKQLQRNKQLAKRR